MRLLVFLHGTVLMHSAALGCPRAERVAQDDCESIGARHITYPTIPAWARERIKSIVVPEFGGIGHLPDIPADLLTWDPA
jgi:hypothetical protein